MPVFFFHSDLIWKRKKVCKAKLAHSVTLVTRPPFSKWKRSGSGAVNTERRQIKWHSPKRDGGQRHFMALWMCGRGQTAVCGGSGWHSCGPRPVSCSTAMNDSACDSRLSVSAHGCLYCRGNFEKKNISMGLSFHWGLFPARGFWMLTLA